jgi:RND family efflux transporter MFP subunit
MTHDPKVLEGLRIHRNSGTQRPTRWGLYIGVLAALLLLGGGVAWFLLKPRPVVVKTAQVRAVSDNGAPVLLNASGYVTARLAATVSSKVTGKVVDVLVEEGLKVEQGQVLAHLDGSNIETNLQLAEAQVESARAAAGEIAANLSLAENEFRRTHGLHQKSAVSDSEADRVEADVRALRARQARQAADISVAERQVAVWRQQLDDTIIRAPFTGIVTSKNAQPGEMISPMSAGGGFTRTGICTLVDMGSLEIEVDVNESYINRVVPGQPAVAVLDAYPDWRIPSKVIAIIPTADRQKASVKVRVGFEKLDARILPDMGVKVAFEGTAADKAQVMRALIPAASLRSRNGKDFVLVLSNGRAEERAVTTGPRTGQEISISAGLSAGETLIIDAPAELADGSLVKSDTP